MVFSEVQSQVQEILGRCTPTELYKKTSRAIAMMANAAQWDWALGTVTLRAQTLTPQQCCVGANVQNLNPTAMETCGYVVLPSWILTPLGINLDGFPTFPRDRWFIHHLNGPGNYSAINCYRNFWDDTGEVYSLMAILTPTTVLAQNQSTLDASATIRLFGLDETGHEIYDSGGQRGIAIPMNVPTTQQFSQITGVYRPAGNGVITLTGIQSGNLLGYYYPNQTNPMWRRVRVPAGVCCVTMTYKRANTDITGPDDWIPLWNENALYAAVDAIMQLDLKKYAEYASAKQVFMQLLSEEQDNRNAQSPVGPQVLNFSSSPQDRLWGWGAYPGWGPNGGGNP